MGGHALVSLAAIPPWELWEEEGILPRPLPCSSGGSQPVRARPAPAPAPDASPPTLAG